MLLRLFRNLYVLLEQDGYFQESFGFHCVDAGDVPGSLGVDVEAQMLRILRKQNLWPIGDNCLEYTEDDLFDVIEFLYDHVSKPVGGYEHTFANCGWHYDQFHPEQGQEKFRRELNVLLCDYGDGYELSKAGEILLKGTPGFDRLFEAVVPTDDPENIEARVQAAISKFRRHRSTWEERRVAIRDLADVLEFLRPQLKKVLTRKDESDLFNIANSFGIRHHNLQQQTNYDKAIWYSWMFYYYLATIHATLRLIEKYEAGMNV